MRKTLLFLIFLITIVFSGCGSFGSAATSKVDTKPVSSSPSKAPEKVEYDDDDFDYDDYEEDMSNYDLLIEILEHAWDFGYLTAAGHDWIMDAYGENENSGCWKYDLEFYGDKSDQVFLKLNKENEADAVRDWSHPDIREGELILTILDMAYYHGYISPSGHDWILDAFRENEDCGYWKYDLEFYGNEEDTIFYYGYELGD